VQVRVLPDYNKNKIKEMSKKKKKEPYLTPMQYMLEIIKHENFEAYRELTKMQQNTPKVVGTYN
jgi:hypothetical protein